jgi:hypothetical protein
MGATLGRTITDYRTLVETCRARADELALSRSEIDRLGGFPDGYSGKLLGKASVDDVGFPRKKSSKKIWPVALESMLGVLGLKILLIEDDAATARTIARRDPVAASRQRFGNTSNSKSSLSVESTESTVEIAPPQRGEPPPVFRAHLRVIQTKRGLKYG